MEQLSGLSACDGLAMGTIMCVPENVISAIPSYTITREMIHAEKERLKAAVETAQAHITVLLTQYSKKESQHKNTEQDILYTHKTMLGDTDFLNSVYEEVEISLVNAEHALKIKLDEIIAILKASKDTYLKERATDIQDAFESVFLYLRSCRKDIVSRFADLPQKALLAARIFKPSEAFEIKKLNPCGIIMEEGGVTSHISIIARAWNIPMLVAVPHLMTVVRSGMNAVLDSAHRKLLLEPDIHFSSQIQQCIYEQKNIAQTIPHQYAKVYTKDGTEITLYANIAFVPDAAQSTIQSTAGIGLFRSEFLFLGKSELPDEEEQYSAYKTVLQSMGTKPVTIRTFDTGADKMLEEQEALSEKNTLLGWRAVRYCLDRPDIFKTQLRALLRAGCYGNLHILIPMISCMKEILAVRSLIAEIEQECEENHIPYKNNIPLGVMIEVPSAAIAADLYAPAADFFSIGTNDLIQYTMAVDRENTTVAHLGDCFHPSILRLIHHVITAAPLLHNKQGGFVSMCGEMASREEALPILLGMGLRRFSMVAQKIPIIAKKIARINMADAEAFYNEIRVLHSPEEIRCKVRQRFKY